MIVPPYIITYPIGQSEDASDAVRVLGDVAGRRVALDGRGVPAKVSAVSVDGAVGAELTGRLEKLCVLRVMLRVMVMVMMVLLL